MNEEKWIVITGNPSDGFAFHGPFETATQASEYGHDYFDDTGFYIDRLIKVLETNND